MPSGVSGRAKRFPRPTSRDAGLGRPSRRSRIDLSSPVSSVRRGCWVTRSPGNPPGSLGKPPLFECGDRSLFSALGEHAHSGESLGRVDAAEPFHATGDFEADDGAGADLLATDRNQFRLRLLEDPQEAVGVLALLTHVEPLLAHPTSLPRLFGSHPFPAMHQGERGRRADEEEYPGDVERNV